MSDKQKIDSLSEEAKGMLHHAVDSMNDVGEFIDNPKARQECIEAGLITQSPNGEIQVSAEINALVYTGGYLAAFA